MSRGHVHEQLLVRALSCASPAAWCSVVSFVRLWALAPAALASTAWLPVRSCAALRAVGDFVFACMLQSVLIQLVSACVLFCLGLKVVAFTMASLSFGCRFLVFFAFAARALAMPSASAVDAKQIRNSCVEFCCEHVRLVRAIVLLSKALPDTAAASSSAGNRERYHA